MKISRYAAALSAAASLSLAVAACGTRGADRSATVPTPVASTPAGMVIVDKDQVLTCGEGEGEGSAQALCDAIAAAASPASVSPGPGSPEPAVRVSGRPSPAPSVEQVFEAEVLKKGRPSSLPNPGSGPGDPRLRQALLVDYEGVYESITRPGVVVALPAAEGSAVDFISLRQESGMFETSSDCARWIGGSWHCATSTGPACRSPRRC